MPLLAERRGDPVLEVGELFEELRPFRGLVGLDSEMRCQPVDIVFCRRVR